MTDEIRAKVDKFEAMRQPDSVAPISSSALLHGTFMVFDVESVGLHGEGFAVGFVVVNRQGVELECGLMACHPDRAAGDPEDREWVSKNIPLLPMLRTALLSPFHVRDAFWVKWQEWKLKGALLVADCCWPVEARFLIACVADDPSNRKWRGPYPLHDLASILLAAGKDPTQKFERKENELPEHNPLADARQSARILRDVLVPCNEKVSDRQANNP